MTNPALLWHKNATKMPRKWREVTNTCISVPLEKIPNCSLSTTSAPFVRLCSFRRKKFWCHSAEKHRMVWVDRDLKNPLIQIPCYGQGHRALSQAAPGPTQPGLNNSRNGAATASLGNLCQGLSTHTYLKKRWNSHILSWTSGVPPEWQQRPPTGDQLF